VGPSDKKFTLTPIVVIMGVSGSGKTTVGRRLAEDVGFDFCDADDLHPARNVEKMRRGVPLSDEDRRDWLRTLREHMDAKRARGEPMVLACSALKKTYRHTLGIEDSRAALVYLRATPELARRRLRERKGHFMAPSMVPSQFALLEEPSDAVVVDADQSPESIVARIERELGLGPKSG
jgi:gluconokinase